MRFYATSREYVCELVYLHVRFVILCVQVCVRFYSIVYMGLNVDMSVSI